MNNLIIAAITVVLDSSVGSIVLLLIAVVALLLVLLSYNSYSYDYKGKHVLITGGTLLTVL